MGVLMVMFLEQCSYVGQCGLIDLLQLVDPNSEPVCTH